MSELTLLLIEDDPQVRRFLRSALPTTGYTLLEAGTGREGLAMASARRPDVILLDLGLPDMDGLDVARRLREWTDMPILVLSARDREDDKVAALDAGADDYLTKPFGLPELMARIRVAERHRERQRTTEPSVFRAGDLHVDLGNRVVTNGGNEVRLTPIEYKLLAVLAKNAGRVMTYEKLLKEVWGLRYAHQKQYLHVYMGHLRNKLEADPARPRWLITEPGVGYRLRSEVAGEETK